MLDIKNEQKWPLTTQNVSWVRQEAVVKGHFMFKESGSQGTPIRIHPNDALPIAFLFRPARGVIFCAKNKKDGQPIDCPTWILYQNFLLMSIENVFLMRKSVFCTKTFCVFYITFRLENMVISCYLIDTKRWYQCTGKLLDFKKWKSYIQDLKSGDLLSKRRSTRHELEKLNRG